MSANIFTVNAVDFLSMLLMATMLICNVWRLRSHTVENRLLLMMVICTLVGSLTDSASFTVDKVPGVVARVLSNTALFAAGIIACFGWALFITLHMRGSVAQRTAMFLGVPAYVVLGLLVLNLFVPIFFQIDDNNTYSRLPLSLLVIALSYGDFFYSIALCYHMHKSTSGLRFFPGWALLFPVAVGGSTQLAIPSAPFFWPTVSIGIAGTVASLQNEDIYRDRLTGAYNRAFLQYVCSGVIRKSRVEMTGIMIDINGFKQINDKSIEKFIPSIDHAMYEDKKHYYEQHPEADRRTGR